MIELYALVTLASVGYFMNQFTKKSVSKSPIKLNRDEIPSQTSLHSSNYLQTVSQIEKAKVEQHLKNMSLHNQTHQAASQVPDKGKNVISRNNQYFSNLAGIAIPGNDFKHNNMTPFFKGSLKQNMNTDINHARLEAFTGVNLQSRPKTEVTPLFDPTKNFTNIHGTAVQTDFQRDRIIASKIQNNTVPIPQVKVGPGVGKGFSATPVGGFQQLEVRDFAMPKKIDELRVATNPKVSYEGRVVDGQKESLPADIGSVYKNRVETFYQKDESHLFKTTGAYLKEKQKPEIEVKYTNRKDINTDYAGPAHKNTQHTLKADVRSPHKNQLESFAIANPAVTVQGTKDKDDFGKANIQVYSNERDVTTTRTHQGNVMSLVKALVAPIEDFVKPTKKGDLINHPREFGQLNAQIPYKQTLHDPNDKTRTTIKETTMYDDFGNLKGNVKISVYDPNDMARTTVKETTIDNKNTGVVKGPIRITVFDRNDLTRTTIKETTLQESTKANVKGGVKGTVHDPNDKARTTTKETTLQETSKTNLKGYGKNVVYDPNNVLRTTVKETTMNEADVLNMKGHVKSVVKDPNDIARTTVKETLLHESAGHNLKGDATREVQYNKDEKARTTVRETLDPMETSVNIKRSVLASVAYDPNDRTRTTMKETTIEKKYVGGIGGKQNFNSGYQTNEFEAKTTQKEFISNNEYKGHLTRADNDGYKVADVYAKPTQKQMLSNNDYYGNAGSAEEKRTMSYEDIYNASLNDIKEDTLVGRDPTQTSVKLAAGAEVVNLDIRKNNCDDFTERVFDNKDRITNQIHEDLGQITKQRNIYDQIEGERLDIDLLTPFMENPYTKPLNSSA